MRIAGNPKRTQTDKEEVETWSKGKNKKIFQMSFQHGIKMALLLKQSQSYTDLYNIFLFSKARVLSPIWIFIERTQDRSIQCDQKESLWTSCNFAWAGFKILFCTLFVLDNLSKSSTCLLSQAFKMVFFFKMNDQEIFKYQLKIR